ncbi:twin-arginine translocation signal domain-containing protein [Pararhizobium sp. IMCC21322]|uniref:twin-arginine translocation signal domain-containing protein n=1 Tax=Pararhizobium sp. IMCC21322 TaxID=3067903 RepID=UPI002741E473|nr:twin-arginine translocation signal domain-containing protein [Pararhizobium sp. IMCC21322]
MSEKATTASRRDFLKLAGAGAPVAAVAVITGGGTEAEAAEPMTGEGLRKTEHVQKYLESARF